MASLLFITHVKKDNTSGVWKKTLAQRAAFERLGFTVDFVYENDNDLVIDTGTAVKQISLKHRYLFFFNLSQNINKKYDFVYLRKPHGGLYPLFSSMAINKVRAINPLCTIYMEIPTYPYNKEQVGVKGFISNVVYKISLLLYKKNIKEILFIGDGPDRIYGISARKISNGVDLSSVSLSQPYKKNNDIFVFAGIANLMFWHGYDRLVRSIGHYEGEHRVKCYIIGDSEPEFSRLKAIANEEDPEGRVIFLGRLADKDIKTVLEEVNICVDALGRHRSGNNNNSSIKSKEYTAMGMPFIKSHYDDAFNNDDFYVFQVDADESNIPIDEIINWYQTLSDDFPLRERTIAEEKFSWDEILRPIFNREKDTKCK
ncbi:glycosyltransferase [Enterobacter cloacae]|uniref:glycosyltransferase n=2 Tax=Enterobacter TaxID=547 RepID=UPI0028E694F5|nr:glycosyltransferase [Enterobacter cloacae]WNT35031.1 glycosyltransferase [Enterobacter cloacae]HDR2792213.1 glycosyltransferase [Enterobacter asburiae]HDR2797577.1 glycosyltransferase [Enterobacter asburiae]